MSHYTRVKTKLKSQSAIVSALKKMGFKDHMIEVSDTPMQLKGYGRDFRSQKANIRIKGSGWGGQNYVGGMSNDLGFEQVEDGTFVFHVSDYDQHKYNQKWQAKFMQQYGKSVIEEVCDAHGFMIEEESEVNGELYIEVTSPF